MSSRRKFIHHRLPFLGLNDGPGFAKRTDDGLIWLLYDEFTTAEAAPLTSPRTCEPGPGTLTIVDTGNNADIVGGEFIASGIVGVGDPGLSSDLAQASRAAGLCAYVNERMAASGRGYIGFGPAYAAQPQVESRYRNALSLQTVHDFPGTAGPWAGSFENDVYAKSLIIHRSVGLFCVLDGVLIWVGNGYSANADWVLWSSFVSATDTRLDEIGALSLPANGYPEWDADFSTVTDSKTNPAASSLFNADADCHLTFTFTFEATKAVYVGVRHDVSAGSLVAQCRGDGNLYFKDGSATKFNGAVFSDGVEYTIDLVANGLVASIYVDNVLIWSGAVSHLPTRAAGSVAVNQLVTNDLVLSTHPYPALGIATDRVIAPQYGDEGTHAFPYIAYCRGVSLPPVAAKSDEVCFDYTSQSVRTALRFYEDGSLRLYNDTTVKINLGAATVSDGDEVCYVRSSASDAEVFVNGTSVGSSASMARQGTKFQLGDGYGDDDLRLDSFELFPRYVTDHLHSDLRPDRYTLSGYVDGASPLADATVTLSGDADNIIFTGADGMYTFENLLPGTYTVTPTKTGYTFVPASEEIVITNANATAADTQGTFWELTYPIIYNFEGDTIGDNEAALEAKITHNDVYVTPTVRAIDYSTLPAFTPTPSFTQCIAQIGTSGVGATVRVGSGLGFTPSGGKVFLLEGVGIHTGTGAKMDFYAVDDSDNNGILAQFLNNKFYLFTRNGSGTNALKINGVASGISSSVGSCWHYFAVQYNLSTDAVYFRVIEFGAVGANQEDTGWVSGGTVSSPTFDDTEWRRFKMYNTSATSDLQGLAQIRVADAVVDGYGLGVLGTHNYQIPSV